MHLSRRFRPLAAVELPTRTQPDGLIAAAARDITDSVRRVEQAALRRVATVVAQGAAPGDVFTTVAAEIGDLLDADLTLIGRYEPDATFSYLAAGGRMRTTPRWPIGSQLGGNNLASKILANGQPESMSYDDASGPIAAFARRWGYVARWERLSWSTAGSGAQCSLLASTQGYLVGDDGAAVPDHRAGRRRRRECREPQCLDGVPCPGRRGR